MKHPAEVIRRPGFLTRNGVTTRLLRVCPVTVNNGKAISASVTPLHLGRGARLSVVDARPAGSGGDMRPPAGASRIGRDGVGLRPVGAHRDPGIKSGPRLGVRP